VAGGSGSAQAVDLIVALVLSSAIGVERELRQRSAGLRTHTLVGIGSALFMLISKYGFYDVVSPGHVVLDPSRVAAQIVSGIGFIGGGLIFVRRDMVRGLTTAAAVWLTAAVGAAAGAGLLALAAGVTAMHFLVVYGYTPIVQRLPQARGHNVLSLRYRHGSGALRRALEICTESGFAVDEMSIDGDHAGEAGPHEVSVTMELRGRGRLTDLVAALEDLDGVLSVGAGDTSSVGDNP
jgi:putative Mg2+ transporter-C (MgtC) family protein